MKRIGRLLLGASAVMAFSQETLGQSRVDRTPQLAALSHATDQAAESAKFFARASGWADANHPEMRVRKIMPLPEELGQYCDTMRAAVATFVDVAPAIAIDQTHERVRSLSLARNGRDAATLDVPAGCEVQRGHEWLDHLATFANTLSTMFRATWETQVVDDKLGPIAEDRSFYEQIRPPTSGSDLLRNLKWLLDNNAILRTDFYTERSIRRVIGITPFIIRGQSGGIGFDYRRLIEPESLARASRGSEMCISYGGLSATSVSAEFFFECTYVRADMPNLGQVQSAFGASARGDLRRAADPLYYETLQGGVERKLQIRLWPNDVLRFFSLSVTRR